MIDDRIKRYHDLYSEIFRAMHKSHNLKLARLTALCWAEIMARTDGHNDYDPRALAGLQAAQYTVFGVIDLPPSMPLLVVNDGGVLKYVEDAHRDRLAAPGGSVAGGEPAGDTDAAGAGQDQQA